MLKHRRRANTSISNTPGHIASQATKATPQRLNHQDSKVAKETEKQGQMLLLPKEAKDAEHEGHADVEAALASDKRPMWTQVARLCSMLNP